jgi:hypothetical protein
MKSRIPVAGGEESGLIRDGGLVKVGNLENRQTFQFWDRHRTDQHLTLRSEFESSKIRSLHFLMASSASQVPSTLLESNGH